MSDENPTPTPPTDGPAGERVTDVSRTTTRSTVTGADEPDDDGEGDAPPDRAAKIRR
jgi:hypothetical protein